MKMVAVRLRLSSCKKAFVCWSSVIANRMHQQSLANGWPVWLFGVSAKTNEAKVRKVLSRFLDSFVSSPAKQSVKTTERHVLSIDRTDADPPQAV